jgi:hypothetical protein
MGKGPSMEANATPDEIALAVFFDAKTKSESMERFIVPSEFVVNLT